MEPATEVKKYSSSLPSGITDIQSKSDENTCEPVRIWLFDNVRIELAQGKDITPTNQKMRLLIAIVVLSKNFRVSREHLLNLLWGDKNDSNARVSLRQSLSQLKKLFKNVDEKILVVDRNFVSIDRTRCWVDTAHLNEIRRFSSEAELGQFHLGDTEKFLEQIAIDDTEFRGWLAVTRVNISSQLNLLINATLDYASNNKPTLYLAMLKTAVKINPCCESTQQKLIQEIIRVDGVDAAKKQFDAYSSMAEYLLDEKPAVSFNELKLTHQTNDQCRERDIVVTEDQPEISARFLQLGDSKAEKESACFRQHLIYQFEQFWLHGVLDQSLLKNFPVKPDLSVVHDASQKPWKNIVQEVNRPVESTADIDDLAEYYYASLGSMLILGDPGAGKTTTALQLAQDIRRHCLAGAEVRVPVVLQLAAWDSTASCFFNWMVDEFNKRYNMSPSIVKKLLQDNVLLILDGLDEVSTDHQDSCVNSINEFRQAHFNVPLVVCCRINEYSLLNTQLVVDVAVRVNTLSEIQVSRAVDYYANREIGFQTLLETFPAIKSQLTTPLMISVAIRSSERLIEKDIRDVNQIKNNLFDCYLESMLFRGSKNENFPAPDCVRWLAWLAKMMRSKGQSVFYVEWMQPDWLSKSWQAHFVSTGSIMLSGILVATVVSYFGSQNATNNFSSIVSYSFGIVGGFIGGIIGLGDVIQPITKIRFSLKAFLSQFSSYIPKGILVSLILGTGVSLILDMMSAIIIATVIMVGFATYMAVDTDKIDEDRKYLAKPNAGMHSSLKYALVSTIIGGGLTGLIVYMIASEFHAWFAGSLFALIFGLFFGGRSFMQHLMMRFFLWKNGSMPVNIVNFLDYSVEKVLMYRVGGGYMFIHRSFLEFLADSDSSTTNIRITSNK